jgi:putative ABC transport system permease protein
MPFSDIIHLALRNLREARVRAVLTTLGVGVGVAVIVTMVSFGLGLQRNTLGQFKDLDSFYEIHVYGRTLFSIAAAPNGERRGSAASASATDEELRFDKVPERALNDRALAEIAAMPGVAFVKPHIFFGAFVRSNGRSLRQSISGAAPEDPSSRFRNLAAGRMIGSAEADEVIITPEFVRDFGYAKAEDAVGQSVELLEPAASGGTVVARTYRIAGVLKGEPGGNRFNGLMPSAGLYMPLDAAREWKDEHLDGQSKVALNIARESGALEEGDNLSFTTAVVRVSDPLALSEVRKRITALGFGSFSFMDEFNQAKVFFHIVNAALGLLGGISLLVASFGIANTMLMSILERTREIGIMKALGAEDREIKLIFFVEAAAIGLVGGVAGSLLAGGIDAVANRAAYRFLLMPYGAAAVDFFALPSYLWVGALALAVAVSVAAALYPAARAVRIDPVMALRHD